MKRQRMTSLGILTGIVMLLFSCQVIKPATAVSKIDSTAIKLTPMDVTVKGGKVGISLNVDSLVAVYEKKRGRYLVDSIAAAAKGQVIPPAPETEKQSFTDPETKAELTYWIDQYGKLQLGCESKDRVVTTLNAEITKLTKEVSSQTALVKQMPTWAIMLFGSLGVLLLISVVFNILMFKK